MADAKHTPGPWNISGISMNSGDISIGSPDQRIVIAVVTNAASFGEMLAGAVRRDGEFHQDDALTQNANARLISAAPSLLNELEMREGDLVMLLRAIEEGDPRAELIFRANDMLRETRAAIAKATS